MAPQQNSTFIDDDSILVRHQRNNNLKINDKNSNHDHYDENDAGHGDNDDDEEEFIKRCSPILPPIQAQIIEEDDEDEDEGEDKDGDENERKGKQTIKQCELLEQNYRQNYYYKQQRNVVMSNGDSNGNGNGNNKGKGYGYGYGGYERGNGNEYGNGKLCFGPNQNRCSRRSRSISVYGGNSSMGHEHGQEITIWIHNEPRYVSGVTKKTTCHDIIKALIDDEIENGNFDFLKNSPQKQYTKDGGDGYGVCAPSHRLRDYSDYVITECWRGIERSYDNNMTILPVWKAWSRVHNELRLRLRRRDEIQDPIQYNQPHKSRNILKKYISKLTRLWRKEKPESKPKLSLQCPISLKENCLLTGNKRGTDIPDEFLFVILPDRVYEREQKPLESIPEGQTGTKKYARELREKRKKRKQRNSSIHHLSNHRKSSSSNNKHRKIQERGLSSVNNNCIRRRHLVSTSRSSIRNSVRYRLAQKTSEMDELYAREYALTRELNEKCKLYKLQNHISKSKSKPKSTFDSDPQKQWKEIVRTEQELLQLKNEINKDISLINNLKRMSLARTTTTNTDDNNKNANHNDDNDGDDDGDECITQMPNVELKTPPPMPVPMKKKFLQLSLDDLSANASSNREMQFVDNIYEFCDNNASMLV